MRRITRIVRTYGDFMTATTTIVDEIFQEIVKQNNLMGIRAIPHSDDFYKYITGYFGIETDLVRRCIKVLVDAHKIFAIEIVAEDKNRDIPRVEGFIAADLTIVRRLKNYFQSELVIEYQKQFRKNLLVHQIVKELFPIIRSLNNTLVGQLANKAIMLEEFERLLEKNFAEFTEEWKAEHLADEMSKANIGAGPAAAPGAKPAVRAQAAKNLMRAVDSPQYDDFAAKSKSYPLQRILKIYGIRFFLQVNLRKYNFSYLEKIVTDGQLKKRSDLLQLREMLQRVKSHMNFDANLKQYETELNDLERAVMHKLYFTSCPVSPVDQG